MTEKQSYTLISKHSGFEVRHYPEAVMASVVVEGEFARAANAGFYPLVQYISGSNQSRSKIAMTAPVLQKSEQQTTHEISFVLPKEFGIHDVPNPSNGQVSVHSVPAHNAVVKRFSGRWSAEKFEREAKALRQLAQQAISSGELCGKLSEQTYFARFDPPWIPGIARHNEALIDIFQ